MPRVPVAALVAVFALSTGCGTSSAPEGESSSSPITGAPSDAGTDAARACIPCAERFPKGASTYAASRRSCFCPEEVCHSACARSLCARPSLDADPTCHACLDEHYSSCLQPVQSACEAEPECTRYVVCTVDEACPGEK